MMKYENVKIQLIDLPPITAEYLESWQVELIKVADAALIVVDAANPDSPGLLETLFARLKEKKVEFVPETYEPPADEAVRIFHKRTLLLADKSDLDPAGENREALKFFFEAQLPLISISAETGEGLEELRRRIFDLLRVIRAYSKPPGKKVEHDDPHVLKRGANVLDIARSVHKDFAEKLAYARLWREGVLQRTDGHPRRDPRGPGRRRAPYLIRSETPSPCPSRGEIPLRENTEIGIPFSISCQPIGGLRRYTFRTSKLLEVDYEQGGAHFKILNPTAHEDLPDRNSSLHKESSC